MTDKDKQEIKEISRLIKLPVENWLEDTGAIPKATTYYAELMGCINDSAEVLFNEGYRKIPDGSVVLTREEHMAMLKDCAESNRITSQLYYERGSKETARKFVQNFENGIDKLDTIINEENLDNYVSLNAILEFVDEIAKQFGVEVE